MDNVTWTSLQLGIKILIIEASAFPTPPTQCTFTPAGIGCGSVGAGGADGWPGTGSALCGGGWFPSLPTVPC